MPIDSVPVFSSPKILNFYLEDETTHKQVLTLFNPYEFPVRFEVLCSAKDKHKYTVVDPQGSIQSYSRVDIVVRHNDVTRQNVGQTDKFRIHMYQYSTNMLIGKKDILADLLVKKNVQNERPEEEAVEELPSANDEQKQPQFSLARRQGRSPSPNRRVVLIFLLFVTILLIPSHDEELSILPEKFRPSTRFKLAVSYTLGLITMMMLRPN